jgi:hypothetical protein
MAIEARWRSCPGLVGIMGFSVNENERRGGSRSHSALRWVLCLSAAVLGLAAIVAYFAAEHWPYSYRNVKPLLQGVFSSTVDIDHFHRTYFPHPGFIATGLALRRNSAPNLPPVGAAKELLIESRWTDMLLLRKEVRLVRVVGLHVVIPPVGSKANHEDFPPGGSADFRGPTMSVDRMEIKDSLLDIMRTNGERYSFPIHEIIMEHLLRDHAVSFVVDMRNARPNGRIQAKGSFGPIVPRNLGATQISGSYVFSKGDLAEIGVLHGSLYAKGNFSGQLSSVHADGAGEVSGFAVGDGQPITVQANGWSTLSGLTGDVVLNRLYVQTGQTVLSAQGSIAGSPALTTLELNVVNGRAQDVLRPFLHHGVPMTGKVQLKSTAHVAPAQPGKTFVQRLTMEGNFTVQDGLVTDAKTEKSLTSFSGREQRPDASKKEAEADASDTAADVISSLSATAEIRDGVLSSREILFSIPGANADMMGTFDLRLGAVHMLGDLRMERSISHAVTGFKSILLKPLDPFFRHRHAGAVVPIAITGVPGSYKVSENIFHQKG